MIKILVLGTNGMLGHAIQREFERDTDFGVQGTTRTGEGSSLKFDVLNDRIEALLHQTKPDFVINCIGLIKPRIDENSMTSIREAIQVNSLFPHRLAEATQSFPCKVIQIATDCVYSGSTGSYHENEPHDPADVYGKTKSLGEVVSDNFLNLRVSIIGPERNRSTSLLAWFNGQPLNSITKGYANHFWNGVSTFHFAKVAIGIVKSSSFNSGIYHLVPKDRVSKYELLCYFKEEYGRADLVIEKVLPEKVIDRTLSTEYIEKNNLLWKGAGYENPPTILQMVREMKNLTEDLL
jgi:dTDP-4-dehydrorhamnose reductase